MKNLLKFIIAILLLAENVYYTNAIEVTNSSSKTNNCPGARNSSSIYITGNSTDRYLSDEFWTQDDRLISDQKSTVKVWQSDNNLISNCDWKRVSTLSPGNNTRVLAIGSNCTLNKPTDINKRTIQVVYNVGYYDITKGSGAQLGNWNLGYFLNINDFRNNSPKYQSYTNVGFTDLKIHSNECLDIELRYCGDGILETDKGETCEATDPSKTGWGAGGCNASCQPITTPVCNAGVTGTQTSPIIPTTPNLCSTAGETVTNFSSSTSGTTTNYVWSCTNGSTVFSGGNCNASYTPPVHTCVAGVTGSQSAAISAATPNLCSTVGETATGFTSTVSGRTTNYAWSCTNGTNTYSGGNCSASYTTSGGGGASCQNGPTVGVRTSPVTATTPGLCTGTLVVGNFVATPNGNTTNYTWTCDGVAGVTCTASYTSGGGGGGSSCNYGPTHGVQTSPISASTPGLCQTGYAMTNFKTTVSGTTNNYSWDCGGKSGGMCNASYTPSGGGGGGGGSYCGDGRVQRPNSNNFPEECDFGSTADRSFCNRDCTYVNNTIPNSRPGEITIPNGGAMFFGPKDNVIIGAGMNPYTAHSLGRPYIKNESDFDLFFDYLCVVKTTGTTLNGSSICTDAGIIHAGTTKYFPSVPDIEGKTITTGNYGDNTLVTTIKHNDKTYDTAYFAAPLKVRVAQSSVATTGGGTSYVSNTSTVGNITKIADNGVLNATKNQNFVGVGVSKGDISSYSNKIKDALSVDKIDKEGKNYTKNINKLANTSSETVVDSSNLSDFESYNGIENVFILKNKNFLVGANTFNNISGSRTYIIENGNLVINANIDVTDNIAFVVKGGNIQVNRNVTLIDGTYISIVKDSKGGKIEGIGGTTTNILNVTGSLYGNINDLINKRTYVKQNSNNQVDVGTIVSFGSSLFRKPAPLISTFISEYLQADKVSK